MPSPQSPSPPLHMYDVDPIFWPQVKKLWSHLCAEIDVSVLLRSTSYKPHWPLGSRNIFLHFGRPKHLSILFSSWKINRKVWICSYMEKNPFQNPPTRMTVLQLALLGIALFWQRQMVTVHEELPSVPLHNYCSELLHVYQAFSS